MVSGGGVGVIMMGIFGLVAVLFVVLFVVGVFLIIRGWRGRPVLSSGSTWKSRRNKVEAPGKRLLS